MKARIIDESSEWAKEQEEYLNRIRREKNKMIEEKRPGDDLFLFYDVKCDNKEISATEDGCYDDGFLDNRRLANILVNPVNKQGISGGGLALEFKKRFPSNFLLYEGFCGGGGFDDFHLYTTKPAYSSIRDFSSNNSNFWIVNFPTKDAVYDKDSSPALIRRGLYDLYCFLRNLSDDHDINIHIPALGCGIGNLEWEDVKKDIYAYLSPLDKPPFNERIKILLFPPH